MKKLYSLVIGLMLLSAQAFAVQGVDGSFDGYSPFRSKVVEKITALESQNSTTSYTADGLLSLRVARVTYDVSADGGGIGAHGLGVSLPANALLKQAYFYVKTQFVSASNGTVALSCEDANNIYSATNITGQSAGAITAGVQTGTAANMSSAIASACEITATVASASYTAGKLNLFLEYLVRD